MNKKVLLIEPNYSNKFPPVGLMKIATYYKNLGNWEVTFFKGDLKHFVIERIADKCIKEFSFIDDTIDWYLKRDEFVEYIKTKKKTILDLLEIDKSDMAIILYSKIEYYKNYYWKGEWKKHPEWDRVGITTLFTFYWDITVETINFAKFLVKDLKDIMVGGVLASIQPKELEAATGIKPYVGILGPGSLDEGDTQYIDNLPLDYSILDEIDYKYPMSNAYYGYTTRGCIRKCPFCAVPTLEPIYNSYIPLKERIDLVRETYGEQKNLLLMDNNVLASKNLESIIQDIVDSGFGRGAKYVQPNLLEIAVRNLKNGVNERAYVRKCYELISEFYDKLQGEESFNVYKVIQKYKIYKLSICKKDNLIMAYDEIKDLYKKHFHPSYRMRYVDFNQGVDARLFNEKNVSLLAQIAIRPLRIAFDDIKTRPAYEKAIRMSAAAGIKEFSNYLLYNFQDNPVDLHTRLRINVDFCDELKVNIYSFPMKYHPIRKGEQDEKDLSHTRDYVGKNWNLKYVRAVQVILNSTKGMVGKGKSFFLEAFGKNEEEYIELLEMPEVFILYRFFFKWLDEQGLNGTDHWRRTWQKCKRELPTEEWNKVESIIHNNDFKSNHVGDALQNPLSHELLTFYKISRKDISEEDGMLYSLKKVYDQTPNKGQKKQKTIMKIHTTIQELIEKGTISNSVYKVCNLIGVKTIDNLLDYHRENGCFKNFISRKGIYLQLVYLYSRFKKYKTEDSETLACTIKYSPVGREDLPTCYHPSISIDELYALGDISGRAYSCCASSCLYTLSDIIRYKQKNGNFESLNKLGGKSISRIEKIIDDCVYSHSSEVIETSLIEQGMNIAHGLNSKFLEALWSFLSWETEKATSNVKIYLLNSFPTAETYYAEMYAKKDILQDVNGLTEEENLELLKIYKRVATHILVWFNSNMVIKSIYMNCFFDVLRHLESGLQEKESSASVNAMIDQFNSFSEEKQEYIENKYKDFCSKHLSVRAKKAQTFYFGKIQNVFHWFHGTKDVFVWKYAKRKRSVTYEELFDCIQEFKIRYNELSNYSEQKILSIKYAEVFPFLLGYQRDFVADFLKSKRHLPLFFILSQYFKRSEDKNLQQYSMYYGLGDGKCWPIEEISKKFNCSNERVRQNLRGKSILKKCQIKTSFDWSIYDFSNDNVVSESSLVYKRIKEEECLKCDFKQFVALLRIVLSYEIIQVNESYFAVCEDVLDLCEMAKFAKDVLKALQTKTTSIIFVALPDYVRSWECIDDHVRRKILSVASYIALESLNVQIDNDGIATILPQKLDKEDAIIQVLENANTPLHLEELLDLLEKEYPEENWTADRVRFYVARSSEVSALGKSKIYALKKWDGVFFGNIREFLVNVLKKSEVPMHIDSLYEKVAKQFPNTNAKSLSSTMNNDF